MISQGSGMVVYTMLILYQILCLV